MILLVLKSSPLESVGIAPAVTPNQKNHGHLAYLNPVVLNPNLIFLVNNFLAQQYFLLPLNEQYYPNSKLALDAMRYGTMGGHLQSVFRRQPFLGPVSLL